MNTTIESPTIYIPPNCITLDKVSIQQIRLFLQGDGGTGKTWSGVGFPNPLILSTDRGAGAHTGRKDIAEAPFYNLDFVKTIDPKGYVKVAVMTWLKNQATKLSSNQTLVVDNLTGLNTAFHLYEEDFPTYSSRTGKVDDFAVWANKVDYFGEVVAVLKSLKCHVVFIGHETPDRGKDGELNGKLRPLITGQFADQLKSHFTDYVRQLSAEKPKSIDELKPTTLEDWKMTKEEFKAMIDSYPRKTIYYWQLDSDSLCNCKVSSLINYPRYLPANYTSFLKYMRK